MPLQVRVGLTICVCVLVVTSVGGADDRIAPEPILLYPDGAPGALGVEEADRPSIRIYPAPDDKRTGAAIVVCPGGGYAVLAGDHEGHQVARWLNTIGVTAAVLKYRLGPKYHHPAPLQDVQRALRYVRSRAVQLQVDPQRIGVMGFSAGGHLASTASTHFDGGAPDAADPIERVSCRPDFAVLCYPVISFEAPFAHKGSVRNLLGEDPDPALVHALSNETQVSAETPPTFLFHTAEDTGVPAQNAVVYYQALLEHKVPAELHIYQNGPHGVGLGTGDPVLSTWPGRLADWLRMSGFLASTERASVQGSVTVDGKPMGIGAVIFVPEHELLPSSFALVIHGKFATGARGGPAVGRNRIMVYDLGGIEPQPTIVDARAVGVANGETTVEYAVQPGANALQLELTSK